MDGIREILDALNARIRSPIFGSIAIMFAVINWKPLFYLLFAEKAVAEKFTFFDANTCAWSIFVFPIVLGIIFAFAAPWIAYLSSRIAEAPTTMRKLLQTNAADKILTEKLTLEQKRNVLVAESAAMLTEAAAKRDEDAQKIDDPKIREDLQKQIDDLRKVAVTHTTPDENTASEIKQLESFLKMYRDERELAQKNNDQAKMEALDSLISQALEKIAKIQWGG